MTLDKRQNLSRRRFLGGVAASLPAAAGALTACSATTAQPRLPDGEPTAPAHASADHGQTTGGSGVPDPDEIDRMHEEGVKQFLAGVTTSGIANQPLAFTLDGEVKVFELTCQIVQWEVTPGQVVEAWTYNGTMPGPEIRVTEGETVRLVVHNELPESTAVHFHGVMVPNAMDGVPFMTQPPIKPGESYTYEFVARNPGSHMYHSHHNSTKQVGKGLLGAFIIERKDKSLEPAYDRDFTIILNDQNGGFTFNGKGFPATEKYIAKLGERLRFRYMNEGLTIHPMHLHGLPQLVFAKDGWTLPQPYMNDTLTVGPGERWDVIVECSEPGVWAFHCHVLSHAEGEHGMFGMFTALVVEV